MNYRELKDKIYRLRKKRLYAEADQLKHELKKLIKFDKKQKMCYN